MELTITQNNALYLIQHGVARRRADFLSRMRLLSGSRQDNLSQQGFRGLVPKFYRDNGR